MDPNSVMTAAQCTAVIVAIIAAARAKWSSIDGLVVLVMAMGIGVGLSFLTADAGVSVRLEIQRGIIMGLAAAGGMAALGYHAEKGATTIATVQTDRSRERGAIDVRVLLGLMVVGLVVIGCAATCPLIHAADEVCPFVVVLFPDGHKETFRREDMIAGARFAAKTKGLHAEPVCP